MYPAELVQPMREDLTGFGFEELHTIEAVESAMAKEGTTLIVVNSVCGCAAANARPGAKASFKQCQKTRQSGHRFCRSRQRSYRQGERLYGAVSTIVTLDGII